MAIGGYAYQMTPRKTGITQQPPQQVQPQQRTLRDDLATVEELTDNYYNAYQTMKDYVSEMAKEYGVDVTRPSFKERGGGLLHQGYQKFEALLQKAANDLSAYKKTLESEEQLQRQGKFIRPTGFDPNSQEGMQAEGYARGYSTELLPEVQKFNQMRDRLYDTPEGRNEADRIMQGMRDNLQQRINNAKSVGEKEFYQMNLNALHQPTYEKDPSITRAEIAAETKRRVARGKTEGLYPLMKKFVVDAAGGSDMAQYERVQDPKTGEIAYRKRADWSGLQFGGSDKEGLKQRKGDYIEVSPSGEVILHFQKTYDDNNKLVEPEPLALHTMRPNELINLISVNNPRLINPQMAHKVLAEGGFMDDLGFTDIETFLGDEGIKELGQRQQSIVERATKEKEVVKKIEDRLAAPKTKQGMSKWGGSGSVNVEQIFQLPNGTELKFKPQFFNNKLFSMDETIFEELIPKEERDNFKFEDMTKDDIIKLLRRVGYVNAKIDEKLTESTTQPKEETPEQKKARELIEKYSKPNG